MSHGVGGQRPGIAAWSIDLPDGWFGIPLLTDEQLDDDGEREWIRGVVDDVLSAAADAGSSAGIADELRHLRQGLLSREDPWLRAAVTIRPEFELTVGCLLIGSQASLDADDDADVFAAMLEDGFRHPGRGIRTHAWRTWRERVELKGDDETAGLDDPSGSIAAEIVGSYQRFEARNPGGRGGRIQDRTFFGVFPDGASEMIRLEFSVSDLAAFREIVDETTAIARTIRVQVEGVTA
jgi:hypothetical protein